MVRATWVRPLFPLLDRDFAYVELSTSLPHPQVLDQQRYPSLSL